MTFFRYILRIVILFYFVLPIAGCSNDVDYTPPASNNDIAITHYSFGKIIIDGKEYNGDVSISPEGRVSSWSFDYNSHFIEARDFRKLISNEIKILIIGIGYNSAASLSNEAIELIENFVSNGIEVKILSTSKAVKLFNASSKKGLLALFHLNC